VRLVPRALITRHVAHLVARKKKNPHGFRRAGLSLVYSDSRLAVAFLNGYVVNSVLAPDLYQGLAITSLTFSRLGKILS
jgi:hypothetical protein